MQNYAHSRLSSFFRPDENDVRRFLKRIVVLVHRECPAGDHGLRHVGSPRVLDGASIRKSVLPQVARRATLFILRKNLSRQSQSLREGIDSNAFRNRFKVRDHGYCAAEGNLHLGIVVVRAAHEFRAREDREKTFPSICMSRGSILLFFMWHLLSCSPL